MGAIVAVGGTVTVGVGVGVGVGAGGSVPIPMPPPCCVTVATCSTLEPLTLALLPKVCPKTSGPVALVW
ncbi:hypothetical protein F8O03_04135 [Pseudoclavibacter terrae]|uniref:Uncharacterized protein n=1 Tax=Pseudoclavibacter terrae TaxID=1530195 RepID=A0A7J5B5S5_9MICO|nr:hypothetical protein F8O03_04135 [Pseudoclavibacter terrae]